MTTPDDERLRRWRLVLGGGEADGTHAPLQPEDERLDQALAELYDAPRQGGLAGSNPKVARWLGEIRDLFPKPVVRVLEQDALERLGLERMLLEPELLEALTPDAQLVATLLTLRDVMPRRTHDAARQVVRRVVEQLTQRLSQPTRQAIQGSLDRASRTSRPRPREIDWHRTIRANLRHYQPHLGTLIAERRLGYARRRPGLRDLVLCVDQSASMANSVVYAGLFASILASLPALRTRLVAFDTSLADLSDHLSDPVELLFGLQLGGGTDIAQALAYARTLVERPADTLLVLLSDLFEGGDPDAMLRHAAALTASGVQFIVLLALSDQGAPAHHPQHAAALSALGAPVFACTPDVFPDLMAAALARRSLSEWAATHALPLVRPTA